MESLIEWLQPELIWFVVGLLLLLIEFLNPGVVIFFFGIGAWSVAVTCLISDISLNTQLVIFVVSSVLLLGSLRKWVKTVFIGRISSRSVTDELSSAFVGEHAVVTQEILPPARGRVEFHGSDWDAESDELIAAGTTVEIINTNSITLHVKPIQRSA